MAPACSAPTAFLLSILLLPGIGLSAAEDLRTDPAGPVAAGGPEEEVTQLIASGSVAEQRFNADKVANRTSIIDAALAFTQAQRLLGRTATDPRRVEVQTHLYWCRKQMDVETLSVFTKRLGELGSAPAAAAAKPVKAAKPIPKPVAALPPPAPIRGEPEGPSIRDRFSERTRIRAMALAAAGLPARFRLSSTHQEAIITGGDDRAADLRLGDAGMALPWKLLADEDWCAIAVDLSRSHEPADHVLASFWLCRLHRTADAEPHLVAAGPAGKEVNELFPSENAAVAGH